MIYYVKTWKEERKICSLVVADDHEEHVAVGANITRSISRSESVNSAKKMLLKVLTEKLSKELEENIFDKGDVKVISHTKVITDLKPILCAVKQEGPMKIVVTKANQYVKAFLIPSQCTRQCSLFLTP